MQHAADSISFSDLGRRLGLKSPRGGSYELIKNRCKEYEINTTHFLGQKAFAGFRNKSVISRTIAPELILIKGHLYRVSHTKLKRCLLKSGVSYECVGCQISSWKGQNLTLDVDHIDGDWSNCLIDNLRFLCPNCHRQTETFGNKNRKRDHNSVGRVPD